MTPKQKARLAELNRLLDKMPPVDEQDHRQWSLNLSGAMEALGLQRAQIGELTAEVKGLRAKHDGSGYQTGVSDE